MDLTQLHWLYKLGIISCMYIALISIDFSANIINNMLSGFRYRTIEKIITAIGGLAMIAYVLIACAAIRIVWKMFWG